MAESEPKRAVMTLDTRARLKAVSHPLRLGILRVLGERELTNEEMAKELKVASGKLYFHTRKLLEVGMIEPAGTRQKGPLTEKLYRAAISGFTAPEENREEAFFYQPLMAAFNLYRNTWKEVGDPHGVVAYHYVTNHTEENEAKFVRRLFALFDEFQEIAVSPETPDSRQVSLLCLMHGLTPLPQNLPEEGEETP